MREIKLYWKWMLKYRRKGKSWKIFEKKRKAQKNAIIKVNFKGRLDIEMIRFNQRNDNI